MVGITPSYTVSKVEVNWTKSSQVINIFVTPIAVAVHQNVYLFIYFTWYATYGLPSASSCTTSYLQLGSSDQMWEFHLFKCQLETWTWICKIKAEEKLDYLLCILGKEGYAAMDRWVPADEAHTNMLLDYIESMLDDEISPRVCVYEPEDITKRSDESIDELVDWIC